MKRIRLKGVMFFWSGLMAAGVFPVRAATFVVDTAADIAGADQPGERSLRWAINQSNDNGSAEQDLIQFDLPAGSVISLGGPLPALQEGKCIIDGDSDDDGAPDIILDGSNQIWGAGLALTSPDNTIEGLVIGNCPGDGIFIGGAEARGNVVRTCYIGLDGGAEEVGGNGGSGVQIAGGAQFNDIGGDEEAHRNVISGNVHGVFIHGAGTHGNRVRGNYIGLNTTGDGPVGNSGIGVLVGWRAQFNRIGGSAEGEGNVISGNGNQGIALYGAGANFNVVLGNYVGTNAEGTAAIPNHPRWWEGAVDLGGKAKFNRIGGETPGERNVISGNQFIGVNIRDSGTEGNKVQGNYVGTDAQGTSPLPNSREGIVIRWNASRNLIGGPKAGQGNLISGNLHSGVLIHGGPRTRKNRVQGNYIGTDASGSEAIPNGWDGVDLWNVKSHAIGPGNVISGNTHYGIRIHGHLSRNNVVQGNHIGVDKEGGESLGNGLHGVLIDDGVKFTLVGGNIARARNVIAGNGGSGVAVGGHVLGNKVRGNYIGTDKDGSLDIPNGGAGVHLWHMAENTRIGGILPGQGNVISGNRLDGVLLQDGGTGFNAIQGNLIGTDKTGTQPLGNQRNGVRIGDPLRGWSQYNLIGGAKEGARNVISASGSYGVAIGWASDNNQVRGNLIGTDTTGTQPLGNSQAGVVVGWDVVGTTVARNVISGNDQYGIGPGAGSFSRVVGNYVGTGRDGITPLPNEKDGIHLNQGRGNRIGGLREAERNVVAGNGGHGIYVNVDGNKLRGNFIGADADGNPLGNAASGVYLDIWADRNLCQGNRITDNADDGVTLKGRWNRLTRNSTYDNGDLGIDYKANGVTDPDPLKIDEVVSNGDGTYTVSGTAPANSIVEVFRAEEDPSGYGEGKEFLEGTTADGDGNWSVVIGADSGDPLTATAFAHPDQRNNTSEFCENVTVPSG